VEISGDYTGFWIPLTGLISILYPLPQPQPSQRGRVPRRRWLGGGERVGGGLRRGGGYVRRGRWRGETHRRKG